MALGMVATQAMNLVPAAMQWAESQRLGAEAPKPPQLRESIQWNQFRPGQTTPKSLPYKSGQFATPDQVRDQAEQAFAGVKFPGQTQLMIEDEVQRYQEALQKRDQELEALNRFSLTNAASMDRMKGTTDQDYEKALSEGNYGFSLARQGVAKAEKKSKESLQNTIQGLGAMIKGFRTDFNSQIASMRGLKDEFLAEAKNETSKLLVDHARATDMQTRAQVEDAMNEMEAQGIPSFQRVSKAIDIRMAGARNLGDQALKMQAQRTYEIEGFKLTFDTNEANARIAYQAAFSGVLQQGMGVLGGAFAGYADRAKALAVVEKDIAKDQATWRSSINANKNWIEAQIRETEMRGAVIEKASWEGLTVPGLRWGPYAEGLLSFDLGIQQTQWAMNQQAFATKAGITSFGLEGMYLGMDNITQLRIAEMQADAAKQSGKYGMYSGIIEGGANIASAGLYGMAQQQPTAPTPGGLGGK